MTQSQLAELFKNSNEELKLHEEYNNKLEDTYNNRIEDWNEKLINILQFIHSDDRKVVDDAQYQSLFFQQELENEIYKIAKVLSKINSQIKQKNRDKLLHYTKGFDLATNATEKKALIEADLAEMQRTFNLHEIYIEYLRATKDRARDFNFSIKNKIQLMDIIR